MGGAASAIIGGLDLLKSRGGGLTKPQAEIVQTLCGNATVLLSLIEDATGVHTANVDSMFKLNVTDGVGVRSGILAQCWRSVRLQSRFAHKLEQISVYFNVSDALPTTISIDQGRISVAVMNLMSNAIERTSAGGAVRGGRPK